MAFQLNAQITPQKVDSATHKLEGTRQKKVAVLDSTRLKGNTVIDKFKQKPNVINSKIDAAIDKLGGSDQQSTEEIDSTELKRNKARDRAQFRPEAIQHRLDSINRAMKQDQQAKRNPVDSANAKIDQVLNKIQLPSGHGNNKVDSVKNKLDSIQQKGLSFIDPSTLKIEQTKNRYTDSLTTRVNKYQSQLHINKLTSKIDSLKTAGLPSATYQRKLDSLNNLSGLAQKSLQKPTEKMNQAQSKIQNLQDAPTGKINEKIDLLSKEAGGKGNLERVNLPKSDLNVGKDIMPNGLNLPQTNLDTKQSIPSLNQSSLSTPENPLNKNLDLPKGLDKKADLNKLDQLQKGAGELSKTTDKAGDKVKVYTEDVKNIKDGNLDKAKTIQEDAISKLPVNDELKVLKEKDQFIKDQQAVIAPYKNLTEYKKQTLARGKKMVALQMATNAKQLQQMVGKVSNYQNKMGTILSKTSDLPKKRDALKKLKTWERLVPGLTVQIQRPHAWLVDINPSLRYRITSYWSAGLGWNERVVFGNYALSRDQARVFGARAFTEVVIFKGLSVRLDAEDMNTFIIPRRQLQDAGEHIWVWSYMAGIKKEFSFIPKVIGNVQFMYNVYSSNADNAYPTRFNVRFGFEHILKRKVKKRK